MRSGMPASMAASAGRVVRSRIQIDRKRRRRSSADKPDQIDATLKLRAGMAEIDRLGDARFGGKKFPSVTRGRREKHDAAAGRSSGNRADERQMPDDVADAGFDLDDRRCGRIRAHIACRAKGCDMRFVDHGPQSENWPADAYGFVRLCTAGGPHRAAAGVAARQRQASGGAARHRRGIGRPHATRPAGAVAAGRRHRRQRHQSVFRQSAWPQDSAAARTSPRFPQR